MRANLIASIVLGLLLHGASASGEVLSAELQVNGLSCPFCAFGIEKKLLDVDGVRDVEVFLDEGRIDLSFQPASKATVADLEEAVAKAGFELAALSLEVSGELLEEGGGRFVAHPALTLRLLEMRDGNAGPASAETIRRLREIEARGGGSVVVAGAVEERGAAEPSLVIQALEASEAR